MVDKHSILDSRLDAVDRGLVSALVANVRRPTLEMAKEIGISSPTVKRRINNLINENIISLQPIVDLHAAGYEYLMVIGVNVEGRSPSLVAKAIAALAETLTVNVVLGNFDIEVVAAVANRVEVGQLLSETLPSISGITNVAPALALDVWKFQSSSIAVKPAEARQKKKLLEPLDFKIIECLQDDARISNRAVATELGISESAVRVRIKRMLKEGQVRLTATHLLGSMSSNAAFVGINVKGGKISAVCMALAKIPEVSFVCSTLGRNDIMCCVSVNDLDQLADVLHEKIASIANVKSTAPSHCLSQIKHQGLLGLVV